MAVLVTNIHVSRHHMRRCAAACTHSFTALQWQRQAFQHSAQSTFTAEALGHSLVQARLAKLLCARRPLRLYEALPHQDAGVHNATLEALGTALAAGVGGTDVLAHLLNDSQQLLVFGHAVGAAG